MIAYGLGILPFIQNLRADHPIVTQPRYADNAGSRGTITGIRQHFDNLMV